MGSLSYMLNCLILWTTLATAITKTTGEGKAHDLDDETNGRAANIHMGRFVMPVFAYYGVPYAMFVQG